MNTLFDFGLSNAVVAAALGVVAWAATRIWRRPEVAFVLWLLVLAKLVTPPLVNIPAAAWRLPAFAASPARTSSNEPVPASETARSSVKAVVMSTSKSLDAAGNDASVADVRAMADDSEGLLTVQSPGGLAVPLSQVGPLVFWAWLAGSGLWFVLAAARIARFGRILRHAEQAGPELQDEVRRLTARLALRRVPDVRLVNGQVPPLVWGMIGRATMLLPSELLARLTAEQRATLLAHELAHLERRDHLVRWLEVAALGLYWWHPVAWWARRQVEQAEEHCCDARVVALLPALAREYAEALVATVDFLSDARAAIPLGARGFSQVYHLKRRMEMILCPTASRGLNWPIRSALIVISLAVLPLSVRSVWADPSEEQTEATEADTTAPTEKPVIAESRPAPHSDPFANGAAEKKETTGAEQPADLGQRLDRLEKMVREIAEQVQVVRHNQRVIDLRDEARRSEFTPKSKTKDAVERAIDYLRDESKTKGSVDATKQMQPMKTMKTDQIRKQVAQKSEAEKIRERATKINAVTKEKRKEFQLKALRLKEQRLNEGLEKIQRDLEEIQREEERLEGQLGDDDDDADTDVIERAIERRR